MKVLASKVAPDDETAVALAGVLRRITEVSGAKSAAAVARALGISAKSLFSCKLRGSIPFKHVCAFARRKDISLDWLLLGQGAPGPVGNRIESSLLVEIARLIYERIQGMGRIDMSFVIGQASRVYERAIAARDQDTRTSLIEGEVEGVAAALAAAKAHLEKAPARGKSK